MIESKMLLTLDSETFNVDSTSQSDVKVIETRNGFIVNVDGQLVLETGSLPHYTVIVSGAMKTLTLRDVQTQCVLIRSEEISSVVSDNCHSSSFIVTTPIKFYEQTLPEPWLTKTTSCSLHV